MLINAIDESNNRAQAFRGLDINMIREEMRGPDEVGGSCSKADRNDLTALCKIFSSS